MGQPTDPCDVDADLLLDCNDETCDLEALDEQLAMCSVDDKSDGIGDTFREWMERLQAKLADKAKACYEAEDAGCLERVYWALAAGAKVKGMGNAAAMMWNFLGCGDDPAYIDEDDVQDDESAAAAIAHMRTEAWQLAAQRVTEGAFGTTTEVALTTKTVSADSADLWYAMGTFSIRGVARLKIGATDIESVEINFTAFDRYDWHPGASAGGDAEGVSSFEDEWAQFLVDEGAACEFEMRSPWSELLTEEPQPPAFDPETIPRNDGDCCAAHGGVGCEIGECQMEVCTSDPYCCTNEWEALCVQQALAVEACECEEVATGGSDDGSAPKAGSCMDMCDEIWVVDCGCNETCMQFEDCCPDYMTACG